jgi:O-methyltransferase
LPVIHKAWFRDLAPADIPPQICFAFLDGDFYESIRDSLRLVWPQLAPRAIVVVDDYQSEALSGAKRAVDEWLAHHPARLQVADSLAILRV